MPRAQQSECGAPAAPKGAPWVSSTWQLLASTERLAGSWVACCGKGEACGCPAPEERSGLMGATGSGGVGGVLG